MAKQRAPERFTKSSVMVGIGEGDEEVLETLADLRAVGVDIVTIGQYLRPSPKHAAVDRFVTPETFEVYRRQAEALGFLYAASGPLVRSSYKAAEVFIRSKLTGNGEDLAQTEALLAERVERANREAKRVVAQLAEQGEEPDDPSSRLGEAHLASSLIHSDELVPATRLLRR